MAVGKVKQNQTNKSNNNRQCFERGKNLFRCKKKCEKEDRKNITLVIFDLLCYFHLFDILEHNEYFWGVGD